MVVSAEGCLALADVTMTDHIGFFEPFGVWRQAR